MTHLTREQVRQVDRLAIEELGIPGVVLMENAGRNAAGIIQRFMHERGVALSSAVIFCGGGNNGGDGYVIARHLHNRGVRVTIFAHKPVEELTGDAETNARICKKMGLPIQSASSFCTHAFAPSVIIDALLGTGFRGELRPDILELIQFINAQRDRPGTQAPPVVVAIDIPSGLDCDTGRPPDTPPDHPAQAAVRADLTITFVAPKSGFAEPTAQPYLGRLEVADIGAPPDLIERVCL